MNFRMFQGQQYSAGQSPRFTTPLVTTVTHHDREHHANGKYLTPDRSGSTDAATVLSESEQLDCIRQQAFRAIKQGSCNVAIDLFSLLLNRNPHSVSDYNNRGLLYFQSGRFDRALADYNRALQLNPSLAKVYNNRANCHAAMGRLVEALFDYETALDFNPANVRARINQGITFRQLEMYEQAIENFDLALQFNQLLNHPDPVDGATLIAGNIFAQRGRASHLAGDWNYAIADYHRAIAMLPSIDLSPLNASDRLRLQIETWLNDLLNPIIEV